MKAILNIGYLHILLPDEKLAIAAVKALSKGVFCHDNIIVKNTVEVSKDSDLFLEMKIVPSHTRVIECNPSKTSKP